MVVIDSKVMKKLKPYVAVIFLQFGGAGFGIVAKAALNNGTSHFTFSVYRNLVAATIFVPFAFILERKVRPKMTLSVFIKIFMLGLLDPVIGQNLFYAGMNLTTATFAAALCNLLPALTFVMAWILRVEKVNLKEIRSHAKILGTVVAVGGAMIMTLIRGSTIGLPWTHESDDHTSGSSNSHDQRIKGAVMVVAGNFGYALFYILQAHTLKSYPAGLSLTALICTLGTLMGTVVTFIAERSNTAIWALGWNAKLLGYVYGGVVSSGITYYVAGMIMKEKDPVFVTAFNPLALVIIAVLSSFIFAEQMTVGKVTGALVIVIGLYMVIWGKGKDYRKDNIEQQGNTEGNSPPMKGGDAAQRSQAVTADSAV